MGINYWKKGSDEATCWWSNANIPSCLCIVNKLRVIAKCWDRKCKGFDATFKAAAIYNFLVQAVIGILLFSFYSAVMRIFFTEMGLVMPFSCQFSGISSISFAAHIKSKTQPVLDAR